MNEQPLINFSFSTQTNLSIGEQIRSLRLSKNMTHKQMAYSLNITPQAYGKIERNETCLTLDRLIQIAHVLGLQAWQVILPNTLSENFKQFTKSDSYRMALNDLSNSAQCKKTEKNNAPEYSSEQSFEKISRDQTDKADLWSIIHYQQNEMENLRQEKAQLLEMLRALQLMLHKAA